MSDSNELDELQELFLAGIGDRLHEVGEIIAQLSSGEDLESKVRTLARHLHTIKGEAGLLGFTAIEKVCHACEDVLVSHDNAGKVDSNTEVALFQAIDTIHSFAGDYQAGEAVDEEFLADVLGGLAESVIEAPEEAAEETPQSAKKASPKASKKASKKAAKTKPKAKADSEGDSSVSEPVTDETAAKEPGAEGPRRGPAEQYVRVSQTHVDRLTNHIGVISGQLVRNQQYIEQLRGLILSSRKMLAEGRDGKSSWRDVEASYAQLGQVIRNFREHHFQVQTTHGEFTDTFRAIRIQPLSTIFSTYKRLIRQAATEHGKDIKLTITGDDTGLDQGVIEKIAEPCLHLIRNAVVHGLETKEERESVGKNPTGHIKISASQEGQLVRIEFADDGRGIQVDKVRRRAVAAGIIDAAQADAMSDRQAADLIFSPGLSTAESTSKLAGRGVGLDVVREVITAMGGAVSISTLAGAGTKFTIIAPTSLALMRVLLVRASDHVLCLPSSAVVEVRHVPVKEIQDIEGHEAITFRNRLVPLLRLREVLKFGGIKDIFVNKVAVAILRSDDAIKGVVVDEFLGEREIVARPLGNFIDRSPMTSGATIIEDGSIVIILHVPELLQARRQIARNTEHLAKKAERSSSVRILYAEDSVITRQYASNVLRGRGYQVTEAGDGMEALEKLRADTFDLVLTDLQMPRMDGFKLVSTIRQDPSVRHIPVIVLSTLDTPETKRMALDAGADHYIIKSTFSADRITEAIEQMLR